MRLKQQILQENDWGGVERRSNEKPPQILDWVYINKTKHKLHGLLGKITYIESKVCGHCKNRENKIYQVCNACESNNLYWVTHFGNKKEAISQGDYFTSKELKLCTNKKTIREVVQRDWGKPSENNHNKCLKT